MSGTGQQHTAPMQGLVAEKEAGRRREVAASIRTKRREDMLKAKRQKEGAAAPSGMSEYAQVSRDFDREGLHAQITSLAQDLHSNNPEVILKACSQIRSHLAAEENPPINLVIEANPPIVPQLIMFLKSPVPELLFEAAWALTNIASGTREDTTVVVKHRAIPEFVRLISHPDPKVADQAVWALGNIAGDSASHRDLVLREGVMQPLLELLVKAGSAPAQEDLLRNATWTLSNLHRAKPIPEASLVASSLPMLAQLIRHESEEIVTDAMWAISYATDAPNDRIEAVLQQNVLPRIVNLLSPQPQQQGMPEPFRSSLAPAIRTIGNIVAGTDVQTQMIIDAGALGCLHHLISDPRTKKNVRKECCWALSNIAAGTEEQAQRLIQDDFVRLLVLCITTFEAEVKKEAAWAITNLTDTCSMLHIRSIAVPECIHALIEYLKSVVVENKITLVLVECFDNILKKGEEEVQCGNVPHNPYKTMMMDQGLLDVLELLQSHNDSNIYEKSLQILRTYYPDVLEEVPEGEQAQGFQAGGFNF